MFSRIFGYSIKNIFRNKFLSISSILVLTLLVFFINLLLVIQNISFKIIDTINDKMTVSLYLQDEYDKTSEPVRQLIDDISNLQAGILVVYKTKDDVLEEVRKKDPDLVSILERQNPLPETIELSNIPINYWDKLNSIIESKIFLFSKDDSKNKLEKKHFSDYSAQYKQIQKIVNYLIILRISLYVMIALFLLSIWIIIYSIIWNFVYYYRDEIYITRLVGWSKIFIYWPFSLQWAIYAIFSFFSWILVFYIWVVLTNKILKENFSFSYILWDYVYLFSLELLLLIIIWALSWLVSSKRYLK